jgi:hypothetical protein
MKNNKNRTKLFKISLFLLGIGIIFSIGINTSSAANTSNMYVNGSSGNDNWNGLNSTYINGINGPKATIKNATGTVPTNGTVYIASGTYNESNIEINTNMKIIGESQKNTIINGQASGNSIFIIDSGVNLTIENLTLANATNSAITNNGTLDVMNSTFTNNIAINSGGGAINNTGTLDIKNSLFTNNSAENSDVTMICDGGAIYNTGTMEISGSTFDNNTDTAPNMDSGGGAIYNNGNLNIKTSIFTNNSAYDPDNQGKGGAINNDGNLTIDNSQFVGNVAYWISGVLFNSGNITITNSNFINNTAWADGVLTNDGICNITGSNFTNNTAGDYAGAIENNGYLTVNNSKFTNNSLLYPTGGGAIANFGGATFNNTIFIGNNANGAYYGGGAIMEYASSDTINNCTFINNTASYGGAISNQGGVDIVTNSTIIGNNATDGAAVYNDGGFDTVNFNIIMGNTGNSQVYNLDTDGGTVDARYNWWGSNSDPSASIIGSGVNYNPWIVLTINTTPVIGKTNTKSKVSATLLYDSGILNDPTHSNLYYHAPSLGHVPDGLLTSFSIDGLGNVNPMTNTTVNGVANTTFTRLASGVSEVSATIDAQTVTANILNPTVTIVDSVTGNNGKTVTITAKLNDAYGNPLAGQNVIFSIKGQEYNAITNNNGIATIQYLINGTGNYNITANYNGNSTYSGSQGIGLLTINSTPVTPITPVTPVTPSKPSTDLKTSAYPTTVNATTIPMQHTGLPIAGLIIAILAVFGGSIIPKLKK